MSMGLALWLIFELVFFWYFVFLKFWFRIFFCILYFKKWSVCFLMYFVFFIFLVRIFFGILMYFVLLRNCIRIYFVSYFFVIFKNIQKIQNKYKIYKYKINTKNTLCLFAFVFVFS